MLDSCALKEASKDYGRLPPLPLRAQMTVTEITILAAQPEHLRKHHRTILTSGCGQPLAA
jgi:hypothetical protein